MRPVGDDDDDELWKEWQRVFFVGTEWENMKLITSLVSWNFNHLEEAMLDDGELAKLDKPVYFFGATERTCWRAVVRISRLCGEWLMCVVRVCSAILSCACR